MVFNKNLKVEIFYEDGFPYMRYQAEDDYFTLDIPKISLKDIDIETTNRCKTVSVSMTVVKPKNLDTLFSVTEKLKYKVGQVMKLNVRQKLKNGSSFNYDGVFTIAKVWVDFVPRYKLVDAGVVIELTETEIDECLVKLYKEEEEWN